MRNLNRDSKDTMREVVEKSRRLETFLRRQIIGQETVIGSFSDCIKYGWCQLSTPNRPRGTLFLAVVYWIFKNILNIDLDFISNL